MIKAEIISVEAPNMFGFIRAILPPFCLFTGAIYTVKFKCGHCKYKNKVQHDEDDFYHKCKVCKTYNEKLYKVVDDGWRFRLERNMVEFGENEDIILDEDVAYFATLKCNIYENPELIKQ